MQKPLSVNLLLCIMIWYIFQRRNYFDRTMTRGISGPMPYRCKERDSITQTNPLFPQTRDGSISTSHNSYITTTTITQHESAIHIINIYVIIFADSVVFFCVFSFSLTLLLSLWRSRSPQNERSGMNDCEWWWLLWDLIHWHCTLTVAVLRL